MDMEGIDKKAKHLKNVYRIQFDLELMSDQERLDKLERAKTNAAARWQSCHGSFARLFSVLNDNVPTQKNSFDVYAKRELVNNVLIETKVRLQRGLRTPEFTVQPYVIIDNSIVDQALGKEVFKEKFEYLYGTYHSQKASVSIYFDGHESRLVLDRINGYKVIDPTSINNVSIMLAAIEDVVEPQLSQTENTLIVLWDAIMDKELNPEFKIPG